MRTSLALVILLAVGCGGGDDDGNGACADVSGTWDISGSCGDDVCVITQTGCNTAFDCQSASSYSGSVDGEHAHYAGTTVTGEQGTCDGTVSGDTMSGTCTVQGLTCSFNASRQ
jgi:hypothetical protein